MVKNKKHIEKDFRAYDKAILTWKAPEYLHHEKSALWFLIAGLIAVALIIYDLMNGGWSFSVAIIVFAGTYYLLYRHEPKIVDVKISKFGVKIGRHCFSYGHLKSFWVVYDLPFAKRLYLRMSSRLKPDVFVSIEGVDPTEIRHVLSGYLREIKGMQEPFSDTLVRVFKL